MRLLFLVHKRGFLMEFSNIPCLHFTIKLEITGFSTGVYRTVYGDKNCFSL